MPTLFPTDIDVPPPAAQLAGEDLDDGPHSTYHGDLGDMIVALEIAVGIIGSADATSHEFRIVALENIVGFPSAADVSYAAGTNTIVVGADVQAALDAIEAAFVAGSAFLTLIEEQGDLGIGTGFNTATRFPVGDPYQVVATNAAGDNRVNLDVYTIPQPKAGATRVESFDVVAGDIGGVIYCHADDADPRQIGLPSNATAPVEGGQSVVFRIEDDVAWEWVELAGARITTEPGVDDRAVFSAGNGSVVIATKEHDDVDHWHVYGGLRTANLNLDQQGFNAVRLSPALPSEFNTAWAYNTNPNGYNRNFLEESIPGTRREWLVYVDKDRHPRLARRTTASPGGVATPTDWSEIDLTTKFTGDSGLFIKNNHHVPAMHIDSDGYVHVLSRTGDSPDPDIGDHYCVSRVPYSLTLADYVPAEFETGATIDTIITYPQWVSCSDGSSVLLYRSGEGITGSGPGKSRYYMRRYTPDGTAPPASGPNDRWDAAVELFRGDGDPAGDRGIYVHQVATDPRNRATHYIFFMWRINSTLFNEKLGCIVTHDDFATFELVDGTSVTAQLPLQTDNYTGAMIVDNVTAESPATFPNHGGACVDLVPQDPTDPDSLGRPHCAYIKNNGGAMHHRAYWSGTAWVVTPLGIVGSGSPNRSTIFASPLGGTYMLWTANSARRNGSLRISDVTPETAWPYLDTEIANLGFPSMEVSAPQQPILDFGEVRVNMAADGLFIDDDTTSPDAGWYTNGYVLTIDAFRAHDLAAGRARAIRARELGSVAVPGTIFEGAVTSAPTVVEIPNSSRVYPTLAAGRIEAKFVGVAKVSGGATLSLGVFYRHTGGTTAVAGDTRVTSASDVAVQTAWLPMRTLEFLAGGELSGAGGIVSGAGTGNPRGVLYVRSVETEV